MFWIDTGAVDAQLVAVDGEPVQPITGRRFGLAMAQRIDLLIDLPAGEGAFPILALREGAQERAGIILATAGAVRLASCRCWGKRWPRRLIWRWNRNWSR